MPHFHLVLPPEGARQVWYVREGQVPELVAPLASHRRKFGDLYNWGAGEDGCRLTSATMMHRIGIHSLLAGYFAPYFAERRLIHVTGNSVRLSAATVFDWALESVELYESQFFADMMRLTRRGHV